MATSVSNNNPEYRLKQKGKHNCRVWETLFEVDKKYVPMKPIGNGAFGVVCSAINKDTNEKVAIKKISNIFEFEDSDSSIRALREMKLLRLIRHENVIALKDVVMPVQKTSFKDVYMVYELMDTDLHQIINSSLPISNDHCKYFMFQMLRGLKYLHSANVLHRDLKPANMLVNYNCDLKICDFGLSRTNGVDGEFMTRYVVTRWYRAPELLLSFHNYGSSIDMWSIGCIFAEILGRKPIFPGTGPLDQLEVIVRVLGSPQGDDLEFIEDSKSLKFIESLPFSMGIQLYHLFPHADPLAIDLLQKMLVFDPTKRITVSEALLHPYMADLYDPEYNPPAEGPINLELNKNWGEQMVREEMWNEMLHYHPEAVSSKCVDNTKTAT